MPKISYIEKKFRPATLATIETANRIIEEYADQGFDLTLRQLYYQMVARGYIENSERSYKNFGNVIADGRLAGLIDWDRIVDRLALNWDQVEQYNPPPNPAKLTDSRADAYIARFGGESWELDALNPTILAELIENIVVQLRDAVLWTEAVEEEEEGLSQLQSAAERWEDIAEFLDGEN